MKNKESLRINHYLRKCLQLFPKLNKYVILSICYITLTWIFFMIVRDQFDGMLKNLLQVQK